MCNYKGERMMKKIPKQNTIFTCIAFVVMQVIIFILAYNFCEKRCAVFNIFLVDMCLMGAYILYIIKNTNRDEIHIKKRLNHKDVYIKKLNGKIAPGILVVSIMIIMIGLILITINNYCVQNIGAWTFVVGVLLTAFCLIIVPIILSYESNLLTIEEIEEIKETLRKKGIETKEQLEQFVVILKAQKQIRTKYNKLAKIYATFILYPLLNYIYLDVIIKQYKLNWIILQVALVGIAILIIEFAINITKIILTKGEYGEEQMIMAIERIKLMEMISEE